MPKGKRSFVGELCLFGAGSGIPSMLHGALFGGSAWNGQHGLLPHLSC